MRSEPWGQQHRGHQAAPPQVPSKDFFFPRHHWEYCRQHGGRARPMLRRGRLPCSSHRSSPSLSCPISPDRQTPVLSPPQSPCPAKHTKRIHYPMGDRKEGPGGGRRRTMRTSGARGRPYCVWAGRAGTHSAAPSMAALCLSPPSPWASPWGVWVPPSSRHPSGAALPTRPVSGLFGVFSSHRTPAGVLSGVGGAEFSGAKQMG